MTYGITQETRPEIKKGHSEYDEQSLPVNYKPMALKSQSMPAPFQQEP